jgi:molybdate transport system substrate-binding protein
MQIAVGGGRIAEDAPQPFVENALVVVYPEGNPGSLQRLQDLARPGLKIVLAAEPVPAGRYALEFLDKASQDPAFGENFRGEVLQNVASYEENVRAVLTKVVLGEADAGIVYVSDAFSASPDKIRTLEIPVAFNVRANYPIASISDTAHADLTNDFIDFVLSNAGQNILADNGFTPIR